MIIHDDPSIRLRAAMSAGQHPDPMLIDLLIERSGVEPDFYVRDMLTWSLCRQPAALTVPALLAQLPADNPQARSQSLHTLSKIGDVAAWPAASSMLHDPDDDVARAAWRAAVALVPHGEEPALAVDLARELGRGGVEVWLSLSRALVALGESARPAVASGTMSSDDLIRAHAIATERFFDDPDASFTHSLDLARRATSTGTL